MNIKELGETHINFYQNLKESVTGQIHKKIGDIFLEYKERFLKYGDYCSDMPKAQEKLAQLYERDLDVRKEVEECEKVRETHQNYHTNFVNMHVDTDNLKGFFCPHCFCPKWKMFTFS